MITASPSDGPRWELADWLELEVLCSLDGAASVFSINSDSIIDPDVEPDEFDDEDRQREQRIARLVAEVERRRATLGDAYPFSMSPEGAELRRDPNPNVGAHVYLFCLLASHARRDGLLSEEDIVPIVDVPNLLQACATWAAAGFEEGPSYALGLDPAPASFIAKLATIYTAFGDGTPVSAIPPGAPTQVKDDGVDVISWKAMPDQHAPATYLMAQVASGQNWKNKSIRPMIDRFHVTWFTKAPARVGRPAMIIPFCIDADSDEDEDEGQIALAGRWRRIVAEHGELFYRYRLPTYAARGIQRHATGTHVDMVDWLPRLETFVQSTIGRLQAEVAPSHSVAANEGAAEDG